MLRIFPVLSDVGHGLAWPAVYTAIFSILLLVLLLEAVNVALFAGDKRGERALQVLRELLRLFRRGKP